MSDPTNPIERMLRVPDIAAATGLSPDAIHREINRGALRATKRCRRWLVRPADYQAWLAEGEPDPAIEAAPAARPIEHTTPSPATGLRSRLESRGDRTQSQEGREGQLPRAMEGPDGHEARQDIPA